MPYWGQDALVRAADTEPLASEGPTWSAPFGEYLMINTVGSELYRWNGVDARPELVADEYAASVTVHEMFIHDGELYTMGNDAVGLLKWNGLFPAVSLGGQGAWVQVAPQYASEDLWSGISFNDKIYCGSKGNGYLLEYNGAGGWNLAAPQLGAETDIHYLHEFEGELYAATGGNCALYKWNGTNAWTSVATQSLGESFAYSMDNFRSGLAIGSGDTLGTVFFYDKTATLKELEVGQDSGGTIRRTVLADIKSVSLVIDGDVYMFPIISAGSETVGRTHILAETAGAMSFYRNGVYCTVDDGTTYLCRRGATISRFDGGVFFYTTPSAVQFNSLEP